MKDCAHCFPSNLSSHTVRFPACNPPLEHACLEVRRLPGVGAGLAAAVWHCAGGGRGRRRVRVELRALAGGRRGRRAHLRRRWRLAQLPARARLCVRLPACPTPNPKLTPHSLGFTFLRAPACACAARLPYAKATALTLRLFMWFHLSARVPPHAAPAHPKPNPGAFPTPLPCATSCMPSF